MYKIKADECCILIKDEIKSIGKWKIFRLEDICHLKFNFENVERSEVHEPYDCVGIFPK